MKFKLYDNPIVNKSRHRQADIYNIAKVDFEEITPEIYKRKRKTKSGRLKGSMMDRLPNELRKSKYPIVALPHLQFIESKLDSCIYLYQSRSGEYVEINELREAILKHGGVFEIINYKILQDHRRMIEIFVCIRADIDMYERVSGNKKWSLVEVEEAVKSRHNDPSYVTQSSLF